ncbi:MAG: hypothetical protein HKM03_09860 [Steroidobacteraceae bacterium]|nr:hypothetical protein [Steroidobacteraceae bacterium]
MTAAGNWGSRYILAIGIGAALAVAMGAALLMGFRLATQLHADIGSLQTASALQAYPIEVGRELDSLREHLEVRAYEGNARAALGESVRHFDENFRALQAADHGDAARLDRINTQWRRFHALIDPVIGFHAEPYIDSDTAGTILSQAGRAQFARVRRASLYAAEHAQALRHELAAITGRLQTAASAAAVRLRGLLLGGVLAALVLAAAAAWLLISRSRHERAAREAQERTRDIMRTVREGFFLLDAGHRIGSVWSDALIRMFNREDFAGLSFHDLLKDLVPSETLATAAKYINLLWGERAHENLMKSINPLSQVQIIRENERGVKETRYLQFDFHRVSGPRGIKHVLCSVGDITSSVLLSRELQESQGNANAQLDMLIGMMRTDPVQLVSFLDTADAGLRLINAIMKEPARSDAEFRRKLEGLLRELHSLKGEAAALELHSIAERLHALEDLVGACEARQELSGADFLPLVLKLDEMLAHLRGVREIASRLALTRETPAPAAHDPLATTLETMAAQLARDHGKRWRFDASGLAGVPPRYAQTVKDCLIQMLRNSAVHGIETPQLRRSRAKSEIGRVSVAFRRGEGGYELLFEDDGAGIAPETVKEAALRKHLITESEAAAMDSRAAMALIFRPGLSTAAGVSMDAGRGVGMDVVARCIRAAGGRIGVSTNPGKFTRFKITLPATDDSDSAVA